MNLKRVIAVGVIVSSLGVAAAQGRTLRDAQAPAEIPPASYKGKQYVDSRGCVYIRAGIDGLVQWVPRVSRSRKVVCGQTPTNAGRTTAAAAPVAQPLKIVPKPEAAAKPAPKPVAAAPKRAPKPVAVAAAPKPAPKRVVRAAAPKPQVIQPRPAPKQVVRRAPAPQVIAPKPQVRRVQPAPQPKVVQRKTVQRTNTVTRRTSCPNFTGVSAQYAGRGDGVRCGPQTQSHQPVVVSREPAQVVRNGQRVTVQRRVVKTAPAPQPQRRVAVAQQPQQRIVRRDAKTGQINASGNTRVVPRHVYNEQQAAKVTTKIPKGYRKAWDDDRLNTKRANMTVNGIRQSDLIWTRTVPRKLYVKNSGRVVNHLFPKLRYPYTSMKAQNAAMGLTTSTKNAPATRKTAKVQATGGNRYVQVGTFGQAANANRAAARLQSAGLPVRMSSVTRGGKRYSVVLAGPLMANQTGSALSKARRLGFGDAFVK